MLPELKDKEFMLSEIKRVLKEQEKFMIIEYHEGKTPMEPPIDHRIFVGKVPGTISMRLS